MPSSFNDVTTNRTLRDYVGWAWYQRQFFTPSNWLRYQSDSIGQSRRKPHFNSDTDKTIILRFDSVHYFATVYLNGINVANHTGGHLPFAIDVTGVIKCPGPNLLTVAVNNTLTSTTVPQGTVSYKTDTTRYPPNFYEFTPNFDFFNYAGIERPVHLYAVPSVHISDISVSTRLINKARSATANDKQSALIDYSIEQTDNRRRSNDIDTVGNEILPTIGCLVEIYDQKRALVANSTGCSGTIKLSQANLWWPLGMRHDSVGYLYTVRVMLLNNSSLTTNNGLAGTASDIISGKALTADEIIDVYEQKIGIREVQVTSNAFLINNEPFYFKGFGKHEDSNVSLQLFFECVCIF